MIRKISAAFIGAGLGIVLAGCGSLKMPGIPGFGKHDKDIEAVVVDDEAQGGAGDSQTSRSGPEIVFVPPSQGVLSAQGAPWQDGSFRNGGDARQGASMDGARASDIAFEEPGVSLDEEMEDIKTALVTLKRDLVILEEDLLFPASSEVAVFVSMDVGAFFQLDAVTLKLNDKEVAHHLYTERQVDALFRGGVQRVYTGNVKQGENRLTAFFTGRGPNGRDYRRATTIPFNKSFEPVFVELKISDSTAKYQPEFEAVLSE
ncbi:MAG: hypothetical protein O7H39_01750 [Gammaproteobacteria bacterium]|nr:hypothetical protein [Gammaproteobacteria bacterium]